MLADFGIPATIQGIASPVTGIFDDRFKMVDDLGQEVESALPMFFCRTTDVPNVLHGATCTVNGVTYTIMSVEPDGTGFTRLTLHK